MSARHKRKIQLEAGLIPDISSLAPEEESTEPINVAASNTFGFLIQDEESDSITSEDIVASTNEEVSSTYGEPVTPVNKTPRAKSPKTSSKRKSSPEKSSKKEHKPKKKKNKAPQSATKKEVENNKSKILSIDRRFLNYERELSKIFSAVHSQIHRSGEYSRLNSGSIVTPKASWPPLRNPELSVVLMSDIKDKTSVFCFKYSDKYTSNQFNFLQATESGDHESNMILLHSNPYHMDSLLQASDILKLQDKLSMSEEFLERAIYVAERTIPSYSLYTNKSRFPYMYYPNRALHLALFRMVDHVAEKGCWRTSLELSKVLLGLDPDEDPLGVLSVIDYYAIKSGESRWYLEFLEQDQIFKGKEDLPNHCYSRALALLEIYLKLNKSNDPNTRNEAKTLLERSNSALRSAILKYPSAVHELNKYCEWKSPNINNEKFKRTDVDHMSQVFVSIFARQCYSLWKVPEVYSWLLKNISVVSNDIPPNKGVLKYDPTYGHASLIPLYRRITLTTEDSNLTRHIPSEYSTKGIIRHDPIPPEEGIDFFTYIQFNKESKGLAQLGSMRSLFDTHEQSSREVSEHSDVHEGPSESTVTNGTPITTNNDHITDGISNNQNRENRVGLVAILLITAFCFYDIFLHFLRKLRFRRN